MAYDERDRERAFEIYLMDGTAEGTASQARKQYPSLASIDRKTVGKWIQEGGWEERRQQVLVEKRKEGDLRRSAALDEATERMQRLVEKLFTDAMDIEAKSAEGAAAQFSKLQGMMLKMMGVGEGDSNMNPRQWRAASAMFRKAMLKVPELREVLTEDVMQKLAVALESEIGET